MTSLPPQDPLVALWQTAPKPDTQALLRDLERLNRLHRRMNRTVFAILCGISVLLVGEEATGRVATHGALSAIWILSLVVGMAWRRRAGCARSDALTLNTANLLEVMIARAKRDLVIARCLYAGVPVGAMVGALAMKLATKGAPADGAAVSGPLHLIQMAAGIAALLAMMAAGAILARARRLQVRELSEKRKRMEAEL